MCLIPLECFHAKRKKKNRRKKPTKSQLEQDASRELDAEVKLFDVYAFALTR